MNLKYFFAHDTSLINRSEIFDHYCSPTKLIFFILLNALPYFSKC